MNWSIFLLMITTLCCSCQLYMNNQAAKNKISTETKQYIYELLKLLESSLAKSDAKDSIDDPSLSLDEDDDLSLDLDSPDNDSSSNQDQNSSDNTPKPSQPKVPNLLTVPPERYTKDLLPQGFTGSTYSEDSKSLTELATKLAQIFLSEQNRSRGPFNHVYSANSNMKPVEDISPQIKKEILKILPDPFQAANYFTTKVNLIPEFNKNEVLAASSAALVQNVLELCIEKLQLATYSLESLYDALEVLNVALNIPLNVFTNSDFVFKEVLNSPTNLGLLGFGGLNDMIKILNGAVTHRAVQDQNGTPVPIPLSLSDITKTAGINTMLTNTDKLAAYLDAFITTISRGKNTVLGRIVNDIQTVLLQISEDPTNVLSWNSLLKQLELLQNVLIRMKKYWLFHSPEATHTVNSIINKADSVMNSVVTASVIDDASDVLSLLLTDSIDLLSSVFSLNGSLLTPIIDLQSDLIQSLSNLTGDFVEITLDIPAIGNVTEFFSGTITKVATLIGNITQITSIEELNPIKLLTNLPVMALQFLDISNLINLVSQTTALIPEVLTDTGSTAGNVVTSLVSMLSLNFLQTTLEQVTDSFSNFLTGITSSGLGGIFNALLNPIYSIFSHLLGSTVTGVFNTVANTITDPVTQVVSSVSNSASDVVSGILNSALPNVDNTLNGLLGISVGNIPTSANGVAPNAELKLPRLINSLLSGSLLGHNTVVPSSTSGTLPTALYYQLLSPKVNNKKNVKRLLKRALLELDKKGKQTEGTPSKPKKLIPAANKSTEIKGNSQIELVKQLQQEIQKYNLIRKSECDKIQQQLKYIAVANIYDSNIPEYKLKANKLCSPISFVDLSQHTKLLSGLNNLSSNKINQNSNAQVAYNQFYNILKKEQTLAQERFQLYEHLKSVTPSIRSAA